MKHLDLEAIARNAVERVLSKQKIEDSRVEAKTEFDKDPKRAAKQIAALANAQSGEFVFYIVGLDDKKFQIVAFDEVDMADWWPQIKRCFDGGVFPELVCDVRFTHDDKAIHALCFHSTSAPYVTKGPDGQTIIPWRDGTSAQSIRRHQLIGLLYGNSNKPTIEIENVSVVSHALTFRLLVIPSSSVTFVSGRIAAILENENDKRQLQNLRRLCRSNDSANSLQSITVDRTDKLILEFATPNASVSESLTTIAWNTASLVIYLPELRENVSLSVPLTRDNGVYRYKLNPFPDLLD